MSVQAHHIRRPVGTVQFTSNESIKHETFDSAPYSDPLRPQALEAAAPHHPNHTFRHLANALKEADRQKSRPSRPNDTMATSASSSTAMPRTAAMINGVSSNSIRLGCDAETNRQKRSGDKARKFMDGVFSPPPQNNVTVNKKTPYKNNKKKVNTTTTKKNNNNGESTEMSSIRSLSDYFDSALKEAQQVTGKRALQQDLEGKHNKDRIMNTCDPDIMALLDGDKTTKTIHHHVAKTEENDDDVFMHELQDTSRDYLYVPICESERRNLATTTTSNDDDDDDETNELKFSIRNAHGSPKTSSAELASFSFSSLPNTNMHEPFLKKVLLSSIRDAELERDREKKLRQTPHGALKSLRASTAFARLAQIYNTHRDDEDQNRDEDDTPSKDDLVVVKPLNSRAPYTKQRFLNNAFDSVAEFRRVYSKSIESCSWRGWSPVRSVSSSSATSSVRP
eukprot:PhM_4_TR2471/c0_g1_i4/m.61969